MEAVLACPPVEDLDRVFKTEVGEFVLLDDGRAKGADLLHSGDAGGNKGGHLVVVCVADLYEKSGEVLIYGDGWVYDRLIVE